MPRIKKEYFRVIVSKDGFEFVPGKNPGKIFKAIDRACEKLQRDGMCYKDAIKEAHERFSK